MNTVSSKFTVNVRASNLRAFNFRLTQVSQYVTFRQFTIRFERVESN